MPGMDGFELREAILGDARLAHIPIVLLSSAHGDEHPRTGRRTLPDNCVVRSPSLHEAITALGTALGDTHGLR